MGSPEIDSSSENRNSSHNIGCVCYWGINGTMFISWKTD